MIFKLIAGFLLIAQVQVESDPLAMFREAAKSWEAEIRILEIQDEMKVAGQDEILFVGSSSIRLWETIEDDLPGRKSIRRGYGGARFSDLAVYIDRLIANHNPQAITLFVGNDVSGDVARDITPEQVKKLAENCLHQIRIRFPQVPVFIVGVTPTPSRFKIWRQIQLVNQGLKEMAESDKRCHFVSTQIAFLDQHGQPRPELFVEDGLHLNRPGYRLWGSLLEQAFMEHLGPVE